MESREDGEFVITTPTAPTVGDLATLHLTGARGTQSVRVRVMESQLHVEKGGVRYRVRLSRIDDVAAPDSEKVSVRS